MLQSFGRRIKTVLLVGLNRFRRSWWFNWRNSFFTQCKHECYYKESTAIGLCAIQVL